MRYQGKCRQVRESKGVRINRRAISSNAATIYFVIFFFFICFLDSISNRYHQIQKSLHQSLFFLKNPVILRFTIVIAKVRTNKIMAPALAMPYCGYSKLYW